MSIIKVDNLSKKYIIRHEVEVFNRSFREELTKSIRGLSRKIAGAAPTLKREEFWALRDVSFEIQQGERLGIIGRNGAGKSTVLKILSRITEPTTGRIVIEGRTASLLEVGTGFHPELSGRENIYLNGAILGMTKTEIRKKFDEIVAFADIDRFLDTPIKHYSSGMHVRLAFAVAAHLEPEILLVDEVLAVGDAQFQKKCLGKMEEISTQSGRTVIFVSHNMAAVSALCKNAMLLHKGEIKFTGEVDKAISIYLDDKSESNMLNFSSRRGDGRIRFTDLIFRNSDGDIILNPVSGEKLLIDVCFEAMTRDFHNLRITVGINDLYNNNPIAQICSRALRYNLDDLKWNRIRFEIPRLNIVGGKYKFVLFSEDNLGTIDWIVDGMVVEIFDGDYYNSGFSWGRKMAAFHMDYKIHLIS